MRRNLKNMGRTFVINKSRAQLIKRIWKSQYLTIFTSRGYHNKLKVIIRTNINRKWLNQIDPLRSRARVLQSIFRVSTGVVNKPLVAYKRDKGNAFPLVSKCDFLHPFLAKAVTWRLIRVSLKCERELDRSLPLISIVTPHLSRLFWGQDYKFENR